MKKLLIIILFSVFSVNAQNPSLFRHGIDTKFIQIDTLTSTQRDALNIPNNKSAVIYNSTIDSIQYKVPGGTWKNIGGGGVISVNSQTGVVVLDADDLDDSATTNKFVTATQKGLIDTALQPSAISNEAYNATTWNGVDSIAPSKDAVRDKFETMVTLSTEQNITGKKNMSLIHVVADGTGSKGRIDFIGNFPNNSLFAPSIFRKSDKLSMIFDSTEGGSGQPSASFTGTSAFTENRTFTFPNKSGTIALLDDISGGGATQISADSVFVSPTIKGYGNAYALLEAHQTSIDSIQGAMEGKINTAFRTVSSTSGVFTEAFNNSQPNFQLSLDEDVEIEITDAVNGDFLIANIVNDDVSEDAFKVTLVGTVNLEFELKHGESTLVTMVTDADDNISWVRSYEKGYKPTSVINSATIYMDGDSVYDDTTDDASTITLSNCDPGETLKVYINRASAPTLAGTDLVFNQLPNTTAFESATDMVITFIVTPLLDSGDKVIDYYYTER